MGKIIFGDALENLRQIKSEIADVCVTSPPYYGLRDYGVSSQIGLEKTPQLYIERLTAVFREVSRILKRDGTLWIVIADSYKGKSLLGIPWLLALALRDDGWYLRDDIIWVKPNPMPESVKDRCTKSYEHIFMLSKSPQYYFDGEAIAEPTAESTTRRLSQNIDHQSGSSRAYGKTNGNMKALAPRYGGKKYTATPEKFNRTKLGNMYEYRSRRNKRNVWVVSTKPYKGAHFATFPPDLIEPCILAGSRKGGIVLDPFIGSGTTAATAFELGREYIGIELNRDYEPLIRERLRNANHQINILDEPEYLKGACL